MVDSHCHLDLMDDVKRIAESCQLAMIGLFAVGTTPKTYAKEKEIWHHHSNIKVGLGMHPQLIGSGYDDIELFSMLAKESRYIGEVGLDFSKEYLGTKEAQILSFERVVKSCETYGNKVISVHALKSAVTVLQIIEEYRQCKENIYILHWFTGSLTEENTMNIFKKNNEKKTTQKLPMTGKVRKGFRAYCAVIAAATLVCGMSVTAFAASDPITVVNNLSDFIFGLIRAIGLILLGFGIVQVGLSLKSHDPSQRANGFLTLAGGIIITFAKEILTLITG